MDIGREELVNMIIYQVGALAGFLEAEGVALNTSSRMARSTAWRRATRTLRTPSAMPRTSSGVPVLGMKNTLHEKIYTGRGHTFIAEYYADLDYDDDGSLIITREHDPIDPAMGGGALPARNRGGGDPSRSTAVIVEVGSDCICVHSDTPNASRSPGPCAGAIRPYLGEVA